ncbi:uncharacterized protein LOC143956686 isoform X4 [Lithobates pipiens]
MPGTRNYLILLLSWSLTTWYIEALTSPGIQLNPEQTVYIVGENIKMTCVANNPSTVTGYIFYKDAAVTSNTSKNILTIDLKRSDSGTYFCIYYTENGIKSAESIILNLRVLEQPPMPTLHNQKQTREVELVCVVQNPSFSQIHGYQFYRNGKEIKSSNQVNPFTLDYALFLDGCYSCEAFVTILGEKILSQRSLERFLSLEETDQGQCQENTPSILSKPGLKFYGSILAGKLIVLIFVLSIFGVYLHVLQQRIKMFEAEAKGYN